MNQVNKVVQKVKRRDRCLARDKEKDTKDTKALIQAIPFEAYFANSKEHGKATDPTATFLRRQVVTALK